MNTTAKRLISYEELYNKATDNGGQIKQEGEYYVIRGKAELGRCYLCNGDGLMWAAQVNANEWASSSGNNSYTESTEITTDNVEIIAGGDTDSSIGINIDAGNITLPDGSVFEIVGNVYDESTKTYYVDARQYIEEGDTYIYNYYTWNYYVNYTSITYIGQTEEYNKYYEVYYELPDGRSSADLTAEELEQLNLSIDVVGYGRSADDTSLRSLYHFDGDTRDSSYWNYCTDFRWNTGASLTYMDAGVFDGALYLDENVHDFTMILPSKMGANDFTIQFRYYQSYTAAPVTDSYLQFDEGKLVKFNGAQLLDGSGNELAAMPVGSWNEIALIREGGTLYYYLNGVKAGSSSDSTTYGKRLTFHFGDEQQTFKYLDELRVLNVPLTTGGQNYTCTSVPYDTNLTLVLPDSATPVADEYLVWTDGDAYEGCMWDLTLGSLDAINEGNRELTFSSSGSNATLSYEFSTEGVYITAESYNNMGLVEKGGGIYFSYGGSGLRPFYWTDDVTLVVWDEDGNSYSFDFDGDLYSGNDQNRKTLTDGSLVCCICYKYSSMSYVGIHPKAGTSIRLVRMEIIPRNGQASTWEKVSVVTPLEDLNTPTLAVRTDLEITSYQIGGVRPSVPEKGQVWALVESGYITSLQIYTGSAWEEVAGRIWTGTRWVPCTSYNIITLQDMYDIMDSSGDSYEYIYTESGFWSWWQKSWNSFTEKLFGLLGGGSSGGGDSIAGSSVKDTIASAVSSAIDGLFRVIASVLGGILGLIGDLLSFIFNFFSDTIIGGIRDFFSAFTDGSLLEFFKQSNEDGSTSTGLPAGISTVFAFFAGIFLLLPADLRLVLFFGVGLLVLLSVLKLVKE